MFAIDVSTDGMSIPEVLIATTKAVEIAERRSVRKLLTWLRRQLLSVIAKQAGVPQKALSDNRRIKIKHDALSGMIWIGTNPLEAHRTGKVAYHRRMRGARVGRRQFAGSFAQKGPFGPVVLQRKGRSRYPIEAPTVELDNVAQANLDRLAARGQKRFVELFQSELNYALTVEGR